MEILLEIGQHSYSYVSDHQTTMHDLYIYIENTHFLPRDTFTLSMGVDTYSPTQTFNLVDKFCQYDTIQVRGTVLAGMRAKWRKKRVRRLRRKRRKMRQRAR